MDKKNVINFDTQGWPLTQLNIRGIIEKICTYDPDTQRYYIDADDKILNLFPRVLEDDGMGYGVNEKRIYEFSIFGDEEQYCNMFVEKPIKNVELWVEASFYPNCIVKKGNKRYITRDIRKNESGMFEYECEGFNTRKGGDGKFEWILEDALRYE